MKLKEYQESGGMPCTGAALWNQEINENMGKVVRMGRNEKKRWDMKWQTLGQRGPLHSCC